MMKALAKRLMVSAVLVSITLITIFKFPNWLFVLVVETFAVVGLWEYLALVRKKGIEVNQWLTLFWGALIPLFMSSTVEGLFLILACLSFFVFNFNPARKSQALVSSSLMFLGIVYVVWFFSHLVKMRLSLPQGSLWVFYTILLVKGGDAGAYFVGSKYGKRKLIEHISPNKSIEGAWGGLIVTIILSLLAKSYLTSVSLFDLLVLGVLVGIISQLGDLAESVIKRDVGVKDSGNVPGLGGILDVLDSLLLAVPFVYYYAVTFIL